MTDNKGISTLIYDAASPVAKKAGETLASLWSIIFDDIDLYAKKKNIQRLNNLKEFENSIANKVHNIPDSKIQEPPLSIIGPTLESSKYYFEEENLREMFSNLVASSMNSDKVASTHPSFPSIIQNLSPKDAEFLIAIKGSNYLPYCELRFQKRKLKNASSFFSGFQEGITLSKCLLALLYPNNPMFDFNPIVDNLTRLRLIEYRSDRSFIKEDLYWPILDNPIYLSKKIDYFDSSDILDKEVTLLQGVIAVTDFGKQFISACV